MFLHPLPGNFPCPTKRVRYIRVVWTVSLFYPDLHHDVTLANSVSEFALDMVFFRYSAFADLKHIYTISQPHRLCHTMDISHIHRTYSNYRLYRPPGHPNRLECLDWYFAVHSPRTGPIKNYGLLYHYTKEEYGVHGCPITHSARTAVEFCYPQVLRIRARVPEKDCRHSREGAYWSLAHITGQSCESR